MNIILWIPKEMFVLMSQEGTTTEVSGYLENKNLTDCCQMSFPLTEWRFISRRADEHSVNQITLVKK